MRASYAGTRVLNAAAAQWMGTGIATRMKGVAPERQVFLFWALGLERHEL